MSASKADLELGAGYFGFILDGFKVTNDMSCFFVPSFVQSIDQDDYRILFTDPT